MMNAEELDRRFISHIVSLLFLCTVHLGDASLCKDCESFSFGINDVNITFGPSTEHNCNCQWTITSNERDDFATVVILYNTSLPMTSGGGGIDCSARIRLPGTDGYKCNFKNHYCLAFATQSTTCNIEKLKDQIPNEEHSCDSISSWNEAGGSPYKILYNAGNFAGYTKHFTIQYYNINCSKPIIPKPIPIVSQNKECTDGKISIQSNISGVIEYNNSGADSEINSQKCKWRINQLQNHDTYALVVYIEKYMLPERLSGCSAYLQLPGSKYYICGNHETSTCRIFLPKNTKCNIEEVKQSTQIFHQGCRNPGIFDADVIKYEISLDLRTMVKKELFIHIDYIECDVTQTKVPIISQNKECADGKISIQSNMSGLIEYTNNGADSEINSQKCKWRINQLQNQNTYALVVYMEKYMLPETSNGCSAYLQLPGSNHYICGNHETSTCRIFLPKNTKCNIENVKQSTEIFHQGCRNPGIFDADVIRYEISLDLRTMVKKELLIHLDYIMCDVTQTTEQYTTEQPSTKFEEQTTSYQELETESGTIDWYIPIPIAICAFLLGIAGMYGFMRYNRTQPRMKKHDDKTTSNETTPQSVVKNKSTHENSKPTDNNQGIYEVPLQTYQNLNKQDDYKDATVVNEYEEYYDNNPRPV